MVTGELVAEFEVWSSPETVVADISRLELWHKRWHFPLTLIIKSSLRRSSMELEDSLFRFRGFVSGLASRELSDAGVKTPDLGRVSVCDASEHCCEPVISLLAFEVWHGEKYKFACNQ